MNRWKVNLLCIWISQFLSIMGFAIAMPFAPYYIQELGVTDPDAIKLWVALFTSATPLTLAVSQPIWGALADRFGRRLMLLRANIAAGFILMAMGMVDQVLWLVILRALQGCLTGTMTAAQTMAASSTPSHRSGLALGGLSAAVFTGITAGAGLGGIIADLFGYRMVFYIAGCLPFMAALLIYFGTRDVRGPQHVQTKQQRIQSWGIFKGVLPIFALIVAVAFVRQFDMAMVPLLVQEIHGSVEGVSIWAGLLFSIGGVAGLLAGVTVGRLGDLFNPLRLAAILSLIAGLAMIPHAFAQQFGVLYSARFFMQFCTAGLDPVFQIWLVKATPDHCRGFLFGWASTARAVGWFGAPLASSWVAATFGLRPMYVLNAGLFFLLIPVILWNLKRYRKTEQHAHA